MTAAADSINMALFCDFENVALGVRDAKYDKFDIRPVLERLLLKGSIVVKKAYCDWERYKSFKATMHEANFELIEIPHLRQSGKNSADIRLVVDALDLCYTKSHVDTFVIISGDSDFSPLVSKLRENAKQVIGVGVKQSTSDLLIANCDEFIFYDDLVRDRQRAARRDAREPVVAGKRVAEDENQNREEQERRRSEAIQFAVETLDDLMAERGDGGKIWASMLKQAIKRRKPHFNESYFGFRAFGNLLDEAQARGLLSVGRDEKSGTYVQRAGAVADNGNVAVLPTPQPILPVVEPGTAKIADLNPVVREAEPASVASPALVAKGGPRRSARKPAVAATAAGTAKEAVEPALAGEPLVVQQPPAVMRATAPAVLPEAALLAAVSPAASDVERSPDQTMTANEALSKVAAQSAVVKSTATKSASRARSKASGKTVSGAAGKTDDGDTGKTVARTATRVAAKKTVEPAAEKKAEPAKSASAKASASKVASKAASAGANGRRRAATTRKAAAAAPDASPTSGADALVQDAAAGAAADREQP
ncbi:MAG: NYN domain-containing protein [Thauera sp.]|nr:NYN domain-containing protein [Thauera sp.]